MAEAFTPAERELIRREFMIKGIGWSQPGYLARGIWLRRWASGPFKGRPKVPKVVQGLLDRGLVAIVDPERGFPAALFTPAGLEALRAMAQDHRQLDPVKYAHLREELGLPALEEMPATRNWRE